MTTYEYMQDIARGFDAQALEQIATHADNARAFCTDPTQREAEAKRALLALAKACRDVQALASE